MQPQRNRFSTFAEVDQEQGSTASEIKIAPKANTAKKNVVVRQAPRPEPTPVEGEEQFERVERP